MRSYGGGKALKWWLCMSIVMYFNKIVGNVASENFKVIIDWPLICEVRRKLYV
jgi:hypothetical protein